MKRKLDALFDETHQNDHERIRIAGLGTLEKTRIALTHNRSVYNAKIRNLGSCYEKLGEKVWQILCETYLQDIAGIDFSIVDLGLELGVTNAQLARYIAILEIEGWLAITGGTGDTQFVSLTERGRSKAEAVMEDSADSFNRKFIYTTPTPVQSDD